MGTIALVRTHRGVEVDGPVEVLLEVLQATIPLQISSVMDCFSVVNVDEWLGGCPSLVTVAILLSCLKSLRVSFRVNGLIVQHGKFNLNDLRMPYVMKNCIKKWFSKPCANEILTTSIVGG